MSVCMGYSYLTDQHCENSDGNCSGQFGCNNYSLTPFLNEVIFWIALGFDLNLDELR